ncbi:mediator of RNA polymerase II transcription subunit 1 [Eupeodes corollae]|uniref:mediator of RNA polymerase II transcription subunit 1 n=1 Tax=Eupeodes corollae TaxID=290404 RepID=UPI002490B905|nr:mediator of RNA polymerase II transcription subunit 1 [Eupeodes corollae]
MDVYIRKVLRVSVAQICQTIGYNSFQSIPLELLVDSLQKFLQEFARDLHRHVELFNRTEANLDDVALSLQSLNISVGDLLEYINHVQPVSCNIEIPHLPAAKSSNLNFLKPGSKEVLTRPVHIYEHLPPILRDTDEEDDKSNIALDSPNSAGQANLSLGSITNEPTDEVDRKPPGQQITDLNDSKTMGEANNSNHLPIDISSKSTVPSSATREISSVMMTSGGFISPAIEGKTPECVIPDIVEKYFGLDAPPSATPPIPPVSSQSASNPESAVSSSKPNSSQSPSNQNNDQNSPSKPSKNNQNADKKKKIKKKALSSMPPNSIGMPPGAITDKAQRKRFKMLQKSMAKNGSGSNIGNLKSKNHNMSHGSQDKHLKKQYKLKQKQIRQQSIQKQTEAALSAVPNVFRGPLDRTPMLSPETEKIKMKKELPRVPVVPPLPEDLPAPAEPEPPSSVFGSPPFSHSKANHQPPTSGSQDMKVTPPLPPMPQNVVAGIPPSLLHNDEIKLSNEPDRSKLNIFKKISSSGRKERGEGPIQHPDIKPVTGPSGSTTIFGDSQVISLPSGTTITPAPPSGSGRHVYAPPPLSTQQSSDFNSVISVDDGSGIPEGSAVLMQRGDLMIQKPKKRGRKPGSKNQPKILGLNTKKPKKMKKSFFGHHSSSNLIEPLNLSHNSIDNIANIPLGIASTFPIDGGVSMKMKKERKKSKMAKDSGFMHNHSKQSTGPSNRNMAPTKEEFGTINQKLMMMNTVLQPAPPLPASGSMSLPVDVDSAMRAKKERKKQKLMKDQQKQAMQHGNMQYNSHQPGQQPSGVGRSPSPFTPQNFPNSIPNMEGMPMFPFYPFPARPGLIPSHNLFSQLPNMHNNGLFMPPLMGFPPLNQSIRSFFKDEKTSAAPLPMAPEGSYSKVAPLVPDTMKLELSPGAGSSKPKPINSPRSGGQASHNNTEPMSLLSPGHVGVIRKKSDEHTASLNANVLKNNETIEVSSDDSVQDEMRSQHQTSASFSNRPAAPLTGIPSGLYRQSRNAQPPPSNNNDVNMVEDVDRSSSTERRNKEHKKVKKINKQGKKQSLPVGGALAEIKNTTRLEPSSGVEPMDVSSESGKKNDDSANSSGNTPMDYELSPEKRKDHKKMKKLLKETKIKKKKDKKDKNKNKEKNLEKVVKTEKTEKEKRKEEKKDKDKLKKLKKDKKKCKEDKERIEGDATVSSGGIVKYTSSGGDGAGSSNEVSSVIPKITLKLGQSGHSPTSLKAGSKSSIMGGGGFNLTEREQSPELARISPLVTRPPKQHKSGTEDMGSSNAANTVSGAGTGPFHHAPSLSASLNILNDSVIDIDSNSGGPSTFMLPASATILGGLGLPQASTKSPANNSAMGSSFHSAAGASSNPQHATSSNKHTLAASLISEANRPTSYVDTSTKDAEGNRVWICPACGKVDDGSPMIGCDGCDAWYHWVCVGILVAPEDNEDWYCRVCIAKKKGVHGGDKKRKRNKKKNAEF